MLDIMINQSLGSFNLNIKTLIPTRGVTAIFGPSASGKSTLLNIIAGFDSPNMLSNNASNKSPSKQYAKQQTNTIIFNGQTWLQNNSTKTDINRPIHKRRIAYVTQTACLFSHLSVQKNLEYAINRRSKKK